MADLPPQNGLDPAAPRAKAGKPAPIEMWKKQIDYAVSRGRDLYLYVGTSDFDPTPIQAHVDYLLQYRWAGAVAARRVRVTRP